MRLPSACPVPSHVRQRTPVFNVEHRHTPAADGTPSSHSKHTVRQPLSHAAALPTPEYASDQGGWDLHTDREPGCSAPWVVALTSSGPSEKRRPRSAWALGIVVAVALVVVAVIGANARQEA